jgi:peroxiredoxin
MKRALVLLGILTVLAPVWQESVKGEEQFRVNEAKLGQMQLPAPESAREKKYLGISADKQFTLSEIKAQGLIIEIFSMYCPICQAEAEKVNKLYGLIEKDPLLKGKVKVLGVGTGNTPFEVDVFRKKFGTQFPLFPDEGFVMQETSKDLIRTPTFLTVKIGKGNKPVVAGVHIGKIGNLKDFLKTVATSIR